MGEKDETNFSEVFPVRKTQKGIAAKGLFQLLGKIVQCEAVKLVDRK